MTATKHWLAAAEALTDRHERPISLFAAASFILSCADYAGFIALPELKLLPGWAAIAASALFNAVWWGFVRPAALARRASRQDGTGPA